MAAASTSGTQPLGREGTLAFLFPGEGSQYPGMLADLCPHFPELRAVLDTADRIARESGEEVPPSRHLFGSSGSAPQALWATDTAVTAVLSSQWAIFQVLTRLGLRPDAVAGHSSGELPALAAAGVLRTEQTLERQLIRLAAIFRELEAEGAIPSARLVAAGTNRERAEAACRAAGPSVVVAIDNCPHQVVLAGPPDEVDRVVACSSARRAWSAKNCRSRVPITRRRFAAVLEPLGRFLRQPRAASGRSAHLLLLDGRAACPNLPTRFAGWPSRSGPGRSPSATRSRPCTGTDCASSSTSGRGATSAAMSRTSSAVGPPSRSPPTCPGARERPSSTTWWRRSSPRDSRSILPTSTRDGGPGDIDLGGTYQADQVSAGRGARFPEMNYRTAMAQLRHVPSEYRPPTTAREMDMPRRRAPGHRHIRGQRDHEAIDMQWIRIALSAGIARSQTRPIDRQAAARRAACMPSPRSRRRRCSASSAR